MSGQGIEAAIKAAQKATRSTDAWCELAINAALPALEDHILSSFIERLEGEEAAKAACLRVEEVAEAGVNNKLDGRNALADTAAVIQAVIKSATEGGRE